MKYNFSYDNETNIVTISAEMKNQYGEIEIEELSGVGFINDKNEIDAVLNVEGESILLSEMQDSGMIANAGWFSKLIKFVVKAVVFIAVVAVVAAIVVATAGAAAPALVAAGVGIAGSAAITAGSAALGIAAGALVACTVGKAAIQAGTAIGEVLGNGLEQVVDKVSGAILEIIYKGTSYVVKLLTVATVSTLSVNAYYLSSVSSEDGKIYFSPIIIDRNFAVSVVNFNTKISIYTYSPDNARSVAQQAGNHKSPVWDRHHKYGYFDHYHRGDIEHEYAYSHVFYGLPQYN